MTKRRARRGSAASAARRPCSDLISNLTSRLSLSADARSFSIADEVSNLASTPAELELLYHINVGPPFLGADSTFHTAFESMSPRDSRAADDVETYGTYLPPTPGYAEQVYYFVPLPDDDGRTTALLANAKSDQGVSVQFDRRQLPCLSQWKCTQPEADGYVTGIEPGTNFPNFKAFEREQERGRHAGAGRNASRRSGVLRSSGRRRRQGRRRPDRRGPIASRADDPCRTGSPARADVRRPPE